MDPLWVSSKASGCRRLLPVLQRPSDAEGPIPQSSLGTVGVGSPRRPNKDYWGLLRSVLPVLGATYPEPSPFETWEKGINEEHEARLTGPEQHENLRANDGFLDSPTSTGPCELQSVLLRVGLYLGQTWDAMSGFYDGPYESPYVRSDAKEGLDYGSY